MIPEKTKDAVKDLEAEWARLRAKYTQEPTPGALTMGAIADKLGISRATARRIVPKMVEAGELIEGYVKTTDGRMIRGFVPA